MPKVLLSYIHYPCSAPKHLCQAFKSLGWDVVSFGPDTEGRLPWKPGAEYPRYADTPDIGLPYPFRRTYPVENALRLSGKVDLIVQCDANFFLTGHTTVPNICWMIDNHVCTYDEAFEYCHVLFGAHSQFHGSDRPNFHWLPCAYSPQDHFDTHSQRTHDMAFVGVPYTNRIELLSELAGIGDVVAKIGLLGKEYNDAYNSARIGLCASVCGDVPMRVFENAAQGLMVFCDRQKDLEKLGLKEGEHYVGFDSTQEAVEKFKWLLENPKEVERIAWNGKEALRKETYEQRIQEMLSWL